MNPRNKVWLSLLAFVLAVTIIACSCGNITSIFSPTATPTRTATLRPTLPPTEGMPGLAGKWRDTADNVVHTIQWSGSTYHIVSSISDADGQYSTSNEIWDGKTFTWTYYVTPTGVSVTIQATSVSGSSLDVNWWNDQGDSGTDTFTREP